MQDREILQPIKQAFRELYILTDAEIKTRIYSNRMAAHILKQKQFQALARTRGWKVTPILFDNEMASALLDIKRWDLKAS